MVETVHYSPAQKAVAALVAIGKPKAADLLKYLTHEETRALVSASRSMSAVAQTGLELIVGEFEAEFTRGAGLINSASEVDSLLEESFDAAELAKIQSSLSSSIQSDNKKASAWELLAGIEAPRIANYLQAEHPQVGAYILSRLSPEQAANITRALDRVSRTQILSRMTGLAETNPEMNTIVELDILEVFTQNNNANKSVSLARVASIINELESETTETFLKDLSETLDSADVSKIRSQLFRFEDIEFLEPSARTIVFDSISIETLTMALREAPSGLTDAILTSISQRTRRMIESDLKSKLQVRANDIFFARKQIIAEVLKQANDGRFELTKNEHMVA